MTWSDIYTFDLALVNERPLENLVRKAFDARAKYRSIAGQKEYDEYLASKPPDLTAILIKPGALKSGSEEASPPDPPALPSAAELEIVGRVLRADIRYLLGKFYLYYAMLPASPNASCPTLSIVSSPRPKPSRARTVNATQTSRIARSVRRRTDSPITYLHAHPTQN